MFNIIAGIMGGVISIASYIPYNVTAYKGKTAPHRVTWWVWTIVASITLISYYSSGVSISLLWLPLAYFIGRLITAVMSLKKGTGGWKSLDRWCILSVILVLLVWHYFNSPQIALYLSMIVDLIGVIPTIKKASLNPKSEDALTWRLLVIASVINLFAITNWGSLSAISYPLYVLGVNVIMVWLTRCNRVK